MGMSFMTQDKGPGLICYCFGYTAEDIRADVLLHGRSTIVDRIMDAKRAGGCNCAVTNPKGR